MVNSGLIMDRLNIIRTSVNRLDKIVKGSLTQFLSDPDAYAISEHHLRRALEALLDIGRHILAKQGLGKPESYRQVIQAMGTHQIIPAEFAQKIAGMAGYRNRLTHGYADISAEELWSVLQTRLEDFVGFHGYINQYLERNG